MKFRLVFPSASNSLDLLCVFLLAVFLTICPFVFVCNYHLINCPLFISFCTAHTSDHVFLLLLFFLLFFVCEIHTKLLYTSFHFLLCSDKRISFNLRFYSIFLFGTQLANSCSYQANYSLCKQHHWIDTKISKVENAFFNFSVLYLYPLFFRLCCIFFKCYVYLSLSISWMVNQRFTIHSIVLHSISFEKIRSTSSSIFVCKNIIKLHCVRTCTQHTFCSYLTPLCQFDLTFLLQMNPNIVFFSFKFLFSPPFL